MAGVMSILPMVLLVALALGGCNEVRPVAAPASPEPVAGEAPAPSATAPLAAMPGAWQVGDRWEWSDGYGLTVTEVTADRTRFERLDAPGQMQIRESLFPVESEDLDGRRVVVFRSADPRELLPFEVGKTTVFRREYLANGELRVHNTSWTVEGRERIAVPAGEFDCWVLVRRTRSLNSDWVGYERWWYAPAARHYVRMEYRYGAQPPGSRVLMNYHLST
ncbi:MAG: hypothetical protein H6980_06725 [Gammaproteobacteria bacterium]|nr:hypothetical protein [Gammaproteobacteria bacterium]